MKWLSFRPAKMLLQENSVTVFLQQNSNQVFFSVLCNVIHLFHAVLHIKPFKYSFYLLYSRWQYHQQHIVIFKYHRNYCALGSHAISWARTAFTFVIIFLGFCMQVVKPFIHINGEFHTGSVSASRSCLKITVTPVVVTAFSENMSWEYVGMDNSVSVSVIVSIKETSASPLHSVIPVLLVPSANSTQQVCGWKSSLNFLNLALTMTICKVSHDFTISPFSMIVHPGRVLLTSYTTEIV